jgi:transglutaminase-like putative cysteine protease
MHRFLNFGAIALTAFAASCKSCENCEAETAGTTGGGSSATASGAAPAKAAPTMGAPAAPATVGASKAAPSGVPERKMRITYEATIPETPAGAKELAVWIPKPRNEGAVQQVLSAKLDAPHGATVTDGRDASGETTFWHVVIKNPTAPVKLVATADVVRREQRNNQFRSAGIAALSEAQKAEMARYLAPNALVPIDGEPAQIASSAVKDESNRLNAARRIYDEVLGRMRYDKTGTGWGKGDTIWACGSGYGNCTDFHSMFMSMGRSKGIPVRFFMGLPVPEKHGAGTIGGYHCWAEFFVAEVGWVPVDISEADKHPELAQYYFGSLTEDRVSFTTGRDLVLNPAPASGVQNFFIYPIVEADGKPVKADKVFKYLDL